MRSLDSARPRLKFLPDEGAAPDWSASPQLQRFELIPFRDIEFNSGSRWLVKGLLPTTGLATIFGPPKQYKSFVAADVALHIASGREWAGRRVTQGVVIYIVGEGSTGFCDRIAANRHCRDYPDDLPFFLIKARPNLGVADGDRTALMTAIEPTVAALGIPVAAIFIDTLVRTLAGSAENDEGMRNFTDNAEVLAEHFGCLAIAVHHTGKDATKGMRGSSALHGAVVTSWRVEKACDYRARITLEDSKDGESGLTWTADLERHVHGVDEDGDEESVLIVAKVSEPVPEGRVPTAPSAGARATIPAQLRLFMSCLDEAMAAAGFDARPFQDGPNIRVVFLDAVRNDYYRRRGDEASTDAKRKAFANSQKIGVERKLIVIAPVNGAPAIWRAKAEQ